MTNTNNKVPAEGNVLSPAVSEIRELRRQKESMLFERLLLSRGDSNKNEVLSLAQQGVEYAREEHHE